MRLYLVVKNILEIFWRGEKGSQLLFRIELTRFSLCSVSTWGSSGRTPVLIGQRVGHARWSGWSCDVEIEHVRSCYVEIKHARFSSRSCNVEIKLIVAINTPCMQGGQVGQAYKVMWLVMHARWPGQYFNVMNDHAMCLGLLCNVVDEHVSESVIRLVNDQVAGSRSTPQGGQLGHKMQPIALLRVSFTWTTDVVSGGDKLHGGEKGFTLHERVRSVGCRSGTSYTSSGMLGQLVLIRYLNWAKRLRSTCVDQVQQLG
ncbi:unnamed protein product [Prunus armeniaca]|uniref:Uncharacterized protein n=1 Tax=Prunus armeniaca TaxID=36596 RepID=A0A6J5V251_PRUAR|nr:unnamed protein product [Prunus armeniaca]